MNERIKEIRKNKGMNQTEFGAKIGLSQRAIAALEQGGNVTERNINAICQAFNVNPEWLRSGVGEMFIETRETIIQSVVDEFDLTEEETALIRTFLELKPEQRAGVMAFIKNFAATHIHAETPMPKHATAEQKREIMNKEMDAEAAAEKKAQESSASITTSGSSKKFGRSP